MKTNGVLNIFKAMPKRIPIKNFSQQKSSVFLIAMLLFSATSSKAQWAAYNDHSPGTIGPAGQAGTQTGVGVTTYSFFTTRMGGRLTNIVTGAELPVSVTLISNGSVASGSTAGVPFPGTPLADIFDSYVWFGYSGTAPNSSIQVNETSSISYTFTGLNPAKRYIFRGGAVRADEYHANPWFTNRWTLVQLAGANRFAPNHKPGVDSPWGILNSGMPGVPLQSNEVAVMFGDNRCGDMVQWDYIDPGPDGSFSVSCTKYTGIVPAGYGTNTTPGNTSGPYGYGIGGFRLDEVCLGIVQQPQSQIGYWMNSVTMSVTVSGQGPITYQWLKDGVPRPGATSASLTVSDLLASDAGVYSVIASNACGYTISSNAYLAVNPAGVSIGLHAGITIEGGVGLTYGIQCSTNLSSTNYWMNVTNITLTAPVQVWIDTVPALRPQRYYQVVPGPIPIP